MIGAVPYISSPRQAANSTKQPIHTSETDGGGHHRNGCYPRMLLKKSVSNYSRDFQGSF
ncbi:hypothetical protein SAMN05414139_10511 [Burkholderia sp. D7]|jgi:hypothetical protein|nr:hypothetical protein SAMN05414139_10511 [Burkholderia sp. D7]